jgi:prepilin-type N-terminal cleavage/methylation domain-containing protein
MKGAIMAYKRSISYGWNKLVLLCSGLNAQNVRKGFSLVEVMVALVVLLIGMLGVMSMQYYAIRGNASSRELRIATDFSRDLMEEMKATAYANLGNGTDNPIADVAGTVLSPISGGLAFTRRWWVVPDCVTLTGNGNTCADNPAPGCAVRPGLTTMPVTAIRARTCWTDKHGVMHSVSLDTLRVVED